MSAERPKPLLPVADYPLVRYATALLRGYQVHEVAINLHHMGEQIESELGDGRDLGMRLTYSREPEILGTGGGLRRMAEFLTHNGHEPCVVVNGKILIEIDLEAVLALHRITGAVATLVVKESAEAEQWGAIEVARDGRVHRMLGQDSPVSPGRRERLTKCMFTGVHIIEPALLARLPRGNSCVIRQGYLPALRDGEVISAYLVPGYFQEHSTPERYLEGNLRVLRGEARLKFPPGELLGVHPSAQLAPDVEIREPVRVGPGAILGRGAVIGPEVVVGRGAVVNPGARLEQSVIFSGVQVRGSLKGVIATAKNIYPVIK